MMMVMADDNGDGYEQGDDDWQQNAKKVEFQFDAGAI